MRRAVQGSLAAEAGEDSGNDFRYQFHQPQQTSAIAAVVLLSFLPQSAAGVIHNHLLIRHCPGLESPAQGFVKPQV